MKSRFIFILSLLCIGGLIGLWLAREKPPPEVIKIYKAAPYGPKPVRTTQVEVTQPPVVFTPSETQDRGAPQDEPLAEPEFFPEEEAAFWEWLETLEAPLAETTYDETETEGEQEADTPTEIPYLELVEMVKEVYELEDVLNDYGVFVDEWGNGYCPKCSSQDFHLMKYVKTGKYEYWCCMECKDGAYNVVDFVAWMEGTSDTEAARYLAERAGLLK